MPFQKKGFHHLAGKYHICSLLMGLGCRQVGCRISEITTVKTFQKYFIDCKVLWDEVVK